MPTKSSTGLIRQNVLLRDYSSWQIGGPARWLAECHSLSDLQIALDFARQQRCPFLPLGRGSNVLFSDEGYHGLVLVLRLEKWSQDGPWWRAQTGVSFPQLGVKSAMAGFSGLEFAAGIPCSVGGALFMNAGAQGQETKDCLKEVSFVWPDGTEQVMELSAAEFSYRMSPFQSQPVILTSGLFLLSSDAQARSRQLEGVRRRVASQPYELPSAGCVFRNPEGASAGALIDRSGCKGWSVGGAAVSEKHANFLVNVGNATARDLLSLIQRVQQEVESQTGMLLHPEVRVIPSDGGWHPW
jgi:UDP-N-acetylmuramate dehydrogenase